MDASKPPIINDVTTISCWKHVNLKCSLNCNKAPETIPENQSRINQHGCQNDCQCEGAWPLRLRWEQHHFQTYWNTRLFLKEKRL